MRILITLGMFLAIPSLAISAPSLSAYDANGYSWKSAGVKAKRIYIDGFIYGVDAQGYKRHYSPSAMLKCLDDAYTTRKQAEMKMKLQEVVQLCHHFMNR